MPEVEEKNEDAIVKADEAAVVEEEQLQQTHQTARMHQEAHATLQHMFQQSAGEEQILLHFIRFVARDEEHWRMFWSKFRPDGTMTWTDFEKYIHWDQKWSGETVEAFALLEENRCGYITNGRCLQLKRWWQSSKDMLACNMQLFKKRLVDQYGSLGRAWRLAFDVDNTGRCCFAHFCSICHTLGIALQIKQTWARLTEGSCNRAIRYRDLDPDGDMVIQQFAMSLTSHGGTLLQGWRQIMVDIGGHMHRDAFIELCSTWGIGFHVAKWLFGVLDHRNTRYLTEHNDLEFLGRYDPGLMPVNTRSSFFNQQLSGTGSAINPFKIAANGEDDEQQQEPFELRVILSKEEHEMYEREARSKLMVLGIDLAGEAKRSPSSRRVFAAPGQPEIQAKMSPIPAAALTR